MDVEKSLDQASILHMGCMTVSLEINSRYIFKKNKMPWRSNWSGEDPMEFPNCEKAEWTVVLPNVYWNTFVEVREQLARINQYTFSREVNMSYEILSQWCDVNCRGQWCIDPWNHTSFLFEDSRDAIMFKLTHG